MRPGVALACLALSAGAAALAPRAAHAQTAQGSQPAQRVVGVLPFRGNATQDLLDDAETAVREALAARGVRVPDRASVRAQLGVDAPRDPQSVAGFGRNLGATHVITGAVQPLAGQYNLTLTLTEVASARTATQQANVGGDAGGDVGRMVDALLDPAALGPPPVDPEVERRRREEAERRQEAERRAAEEQRRRQADAQRRAWEAAHPERSFDAGGRVAIGLGLHVGGLLSGTRAQPATASGSQPSEPSSLAFLLRAEGAYSLPSVAGLEVLGALMLMTSPTTALGLGGGAQYTFPARGRLGLHGTAGAVLGLFQALSGARITTVWIEPFVRAEYQFSQGVAAFAGASLDLAPGGNGGVVTLTAAAGLRLRFAAGS